MTDAVERGFIAFDAAHQFATLTEAAAVWIDRHYNDLPHAARPAREDLHAFVNLFTTYLDNSFELVENPGKRLYSPRAHCFCPLCSWLIEMPRLRTKQVTRHDKLRARKLRVAAVRQVALDMERTASDSEAEAIVEAMFEETALIAYGYELLRRLDGVAEGVATLALWRGFAWTREGSPKKKFEVSATLMIDAEAAVSMRLRDCGSLDVRSPG